MSDRAKKKRGHLADDLLAARRKRPDDAHLKDAAVAYLTRSLPACRDAGHELCQRVRSAAEEHRRAKDQEDNE